MDRIYRRQRHIYDLSRRFFLLGRERALAEMAPLPDSASVLELGCGTARNLILLAREHRDLRLYGLDASGMMLTTAAASAERAGVSGRLRLALGDASEFDAEVLFGRTGFDRVLLSYMLSMVPDWPRVLDAGMKTLAPGGRIHVVDFGRGERLPAAFRGLLHAWLAQFHVTPRADMIEVFTDMARARGLREIRTHAVHRGYAILLEARAPE